MIAAKAKNELPACPVETTLTLIGDKWKVLILRDLMPGTKRFGELKKSVGNVSQKVLTAQLRAMEENGLLHREVYAELANIFAGRQLYFLPKMASNGTGILNWSLFILNPEPLLYGLEKTDLI